MKTRRLSFEEAFEMSISYHQKYCQEAFALFTRSSDEEGNEITTDELGKVRQFCISQKQKRHILHIHFCLRCVLLYFFIDWFLSFFAFLSNISGQLRRAFSVHSCTTFLLSLSIVVFVGCFLFYNHWFVFCVLCTMLGIVAGLLPDISVRTTHRGQRTEIIKLHIFTQN